MKKTKLITTSIFALSLLAIMGGIIFNTNASSRNFQKDASKSNKQYNRGLSVETRETKKAEQEAIKNLLNSNNPTYSEWVALLEEDCPMLEKINVENFPRFLEAHKKMEEARLIMEELGIEKQGRQGFKYRMKR